MCDFTVITPVYNGEKYLRETINSVLANFESNLSFDYIIINDGSTDLTLDILEEFSQHSRIRIFNIPNGGEAAAVNYGLQYATGKYVLVVNSDDPLISSELFSQSFSVMENNVNIVVVYPDWNIISDQNEIIEIKKLPEFNKEILVGEFQCLPGPGAVFRRDAGLSVGGRNTNFRFVSDYDFWLRMSLKGDFFHIPSVLAQWRQHGQSTSINNRGLEMGLERIQVMEEFLNIANFDNVLTRKAISHAYYHAALLSYFSKIVPGRSWMIKAFKLRKWWIENSDIRIVLFCLFLPASRFLIPILNRTPLINSPIKKAKKAN